MKLRIFLDLEVAEFLKTVRRAKRERLIATFRRIAEFPENLCDFTERDSTGRSISGYIDREFAIRCWVDFADGHLKVMQVSPADRAG